MFDDTAYKIDILRTVKGKEYKVRTIISHSMVYNLTDQGAKDILRYSFEQMLHKMENELGTLRE